MGDLQYRPVVGRSLTWVISREGEGTKCFIPCCNYTPSSCGAFALSAKPGAPANTSSVSEMTPWPFRESLTEHSRACHPISLRPKVLERIKQPLHPAFGVSPEPGSGQPTFGSHGTALPRGTRLCLPLAAPCPPGPLHAAPGVSPAGSSCLPCPGGSGASGEGVFSPTKG